MDFANRFWGYRWNKILIFAVIFVVGLSGVGYMLLGRNARQAVIDAAEENQRLLLHSGSATLRTFLNLAADATVIEAHNPRIYSNSEDKKQEEMQRFINAWDETAIIEAIIVDKDGTVTHIANRKGSAFVPGISAVDREYFKEASKMKRGEVWVGEPIMPRLGAFQGQHLITIASPIHDEKEEFLGIFAIGVGVSSMTEEFVLPLKIHTDADIFLLRGDGVLLYAPDLNLIGKNVYELIQNSEMPLVKLMESELKAILGRGTEGSMTAIIGGIADNKIKERLITYHPVQLSTAGARCDCMFIKTLPTESILESRGPVFIRLFLFFGIVMLGLMVFAIRISKLMGFEEGVVYEKYLRSEDEK